MVGGSSSDAAAFDLDWAGNIGMLTLSPGSRLRTDKESKEATRLHCLQNLHSQGLRSRKQRPVSGKVSANLGTEKAQVLREQSNITGLAQPSGSDWKAVRSQASDLESKGQLQAALNLLNEALKQCDRPSDEMLQFQSDLKCRLNAAGQLNKQAVRMAIHRPCGGENTETSQNSDVCTPSIVAFQQALCFDSENVHGTTGGGLLVNPPSVSSKTPESMSTPILPRPEASDSLSTPDTGTSDDHVGIGVRIQPQMRAATPILQLTSSTEDADMPINGNAVETITGSVGSMMLNPEAACAESTESGDSGDSTSMRVSGVQDKNGQSVESRATKARRSSVKFSQVNSVAITQPSPNPMNLSPACGAALRSHVQDAGHTPYSAMVQSHVTFADETVSVSQQTPGVCSNQEGLFGSEPSDSEEGGPLQGFRSLNAGATPRRCDQFHVKFCKSTPEERPTDSEGSVLPTTPDGEGMGGLSADQSRRLSMNAGCTPGTGHLSCDPNAQDSERASAAAAATTMRTDNDLVAGAIQLDGSIRAPVVTSTKRAPVEADSSSVAACLTFKSDAAQGTAAAPCIMEFAMDSDVVPVSATLGSTTTTPAVRGQKVKPTGMLNWPEEKSGLRSVSTTEPASAPPVVGALFRTPAQGTSLLLHDSARTAGMATVAMHGHDTEHAFDTIQENSVTAASPSDVAACQSTPTLHGADPASMSGVRPGTGSPLAGGCLTAVGKREGTPAFGVVEGLDEPGSCTGTDCSMTTDHAAVDEYIAGSPSSAAAPQSWSGAGSMHTGAVKRAALVTVAGNQENGSPGDAMISPCWLQNEADGRKSATCADGDGGFGSPVGPSAPWTGFDAMMHGASEASTPSLARESTASRSPATLSASGGASPTLQTTHMQVAGSTTSSSRPSPVQACISSATQSESEITPYDLLAEAESQAGFFKGSSGMCVDAVSTPPTASPQGTADLLRESPPTDELLNDSPTPQLIGASSRVVHSSPVAPLSPLQCNTFPSTSSTDVSHSINDQHASTATLTPQSAVPTAASQLPMSPGAMAIVVAAGIAAGSPLTAGEQSGLAPPCSPQLPTQACSTPEPLAPGVRTAVGIGKLRTPGRRELKAILSDSVAQHAVGVLKEANDMSFATARADQRQQRMHASGTVLTPVRRSRRSQVQTQVHLTDKLQESGWAYSPNPALTNRTLSRVEEELLDSMAQLNVKGK